MSELEYDRLLDAVRLAVAPAPGDVALQRAGESRESQPSVRAPRTLSRRLLRIWLAKNGTRRR